MKIRTKLGEVFEGTAVEIVQQMAESAFVPQEPAEYKINYKARAKVLLGKKLSVESAQKFLRSLERIGELRIIERGAGNARGTD